MESETSDFPYRFTRPGKTAGATTPLIALEGLNYPLEYRWLRAHGLHGLTPWHFCNDENHAATYRREFRRETAAGSIPVTDLLPFAFRQDCDDIAGFVIADSVVSPQIIEVHLTWKHPEVPGYPSYVLFDNLWRWLPNVIDETASWCSEEDLPNP